MELGACLFPTVYNDVLMIGSQGLVGSCAAASHGYAHDSLHFVFERGIVTAY